MSPVLPPGRTSTRPTPCVRAASSILASFGVFREVGSDSTACLDAPPTAAPAPLPSHACVDDACLSSAVVVCGIDPKHQR